MTVTINSGPVGKRIILTMDDVETWRSRVGELRSEIAAKTSEIERLQERLDAARLFIGDAEAEGQKKASAAPETVVAQPLLPPMTTVITKMFEDLPGRRLQAMAVMNLLTLDADQAPRVKGNPNNVYTALSRLAKRGVLIRHDDGSYSRAPGSSAP